MKTETKAPLADSIELYLAHKRSLGKELAKVEPMLLLLDRYLLTQGVAELRQIKAVHIDAFVASRSRRSPRSHNGLIGAIFAGCLIGWWFMKCYVSRRCDAKLGASPHPGGHSSSIPTRRAASSK